MGPPDPWHGTGGEVALACGVVAAAQNHFGLADAAFEQALEINRRYSLAWDEAKTLYEWGCAKLQGREQEGQTPSASWLLTQALTLWEAMGAKGDVELCRNMLES